MSLDTGKQILKKILLALLALLLLFEEWLWNILTAFGRRLVLWLKLTRFEEWLRQTPPWLAALAFLIPLLVVTPINLFAFWLMACGQIVNGLLIEVVAKLLGTVLIARVFALTKPQLLTFRWFRALYNTVTGWLSWAHTRLHQTYAYQAAKRIKTHVKSLVERVKVWWKG